MIETYAVEYEDGDLPREWSVDLCHSIGFSYETIVAQYQALYDDEAPPFLGRAKVTLANDIILAAQRWFDECLRNNVHLFGGDARTEDVLAIIGDVRNTRGMGPREIEAADVLMNRIHGQLR